MNLCFANNPSLLDWLPDSTKGKISSCIFPCFNWDVRQKLSRQGLKALGYDHFITVEEGKQLDDYILNLRQRWYLDDGEDITLFDNISLGKAYEYIIYWSELAPAYKFLVAVDNIIKKERPKEIWWDVSINNFFKEILEQVVIKYGLISVHLIGSLGYKPPKSWFWFPPKLTLKKRVISGICNIIAALSGVFDKAGNARKNILLLHSPSLDNVIDNLLATNRFNTYFLAPGPLRKVIRKLAFNNTRFVYPRLCKTRDCHDIKSIQIKWESLTNKTAYLDKFNYNDILIGHIVKKRIDPLFIKQLSALAREVVFYKSFLLHQNIHLVLLPSDVSSSGRIIIDLAKRYHLPTLVMLHGLPQGYSKIENCFSDYPAVFGAGISEIYQKLGKAKEQILITGNPRFDHYKDLIKESPDKKQPAQNIILLTNPDYHSFAFGACDDPEKYITKLVKLLSDYQGIRVTIKLHPSESEEYYQHVLKNIMPSNFSIVRDVPIDKLLQTANLVIGAFSTALLEAILINKPVVCINFTKYPNPPPFDGTMGVKTYTDEQDLKNILDDIFLKHNYPINDYKRILDEFAGPVDGQSSKRLLMAIDNIITKT